MTAIVVFDYAALPSDLASEAREVAERIRDRNRRGVEAIVANGRDLVAMKNRLGHGHFLAWIDAEFGMSDDSARRFMDVAQRLGDKTVVVANLSPVALYQLAASSTPDTVRQKIIEQIESGEQVASGEVVDMVREARAEDRASAKRARKSPEDLKREARSEAARQRRIEADEAEREMMRQRRETCLARAVELAILHLGDDLPEFVEALQDGGVGHLAYLIREAMPVWQPRIVGAA